MHVCFRNHGTNEGKDAGKECMREWLKEWGRNETNERWRFLGKWSNFTGTHLKKWCNYITDSWRGSASERHSHEVQMTEKRADSHKHKLTAETMTSCPRMTKKWSCLKLFIWFKEHCLVPRRAGEQVSQSEADSWSFRSPWAFSFSSPVKLQTWS